MLAIAPDLLRPEGEFAADARSLFGTLLDCPPAASGDAVRYPGWHEAELAARRRRDGVPLRPRLHRELVELGLPDTGGGAR